MSEAEVFSRLALWTEEMYAGVLRSWRRERRKQLPAYHSLCRQYLEQFCAVFANRAGGELPRQQQRRFRLLCDDFEALRGGIGGPRRLCLCGCAGAGKSTLLNALLALPADAGSRPGTPPDSLILSAWSAQLPPGKAELVSIGSDGRLKRRQLGRTEAEKRAAAEDEAFVRSRESCRQKIDELCDGVWLEDERERIRSDTYRKNLRRSHIWEVCRGVDETPFSRCFLLSEAPGFSRELCFADRVRELRSCGVDMLLWVIDAGALDRAAVTDAYHEELRLAEEAGYPMLVIVNLRDSSGSVRPGSPRWEGLRRKAQALFGAVHPIRAAACVNARLAWESVIRDDAELAEASGLPALRELLGGLFAPEDTDRWLDEQVGRLDAALDRCLREAEAACLAQERLLALYHAAEAELEALAEDCRRAFEEKKAALLERFLPALRARIGENRAAVDAMFRTALWDTALVEETILRRGELEAAMAALAAENSKNLRKRFRAQRRRCVVGLNLSQPYQKTGCRVYAGPLSEEAPAAPVPLPADLSLKIFRNAGASFLASGSIIRPGAAAVPIQSPEDYLYTQLESALRAWAGAVTADGALAPCLRDCRATLDKSMADACATPETTGEVCAALRRLIQNRPHMDWQDVPVEELL